MYTQVITSCRGEWYAVQHAVQTRREAVFGYFCFKCRLQLHEFERVKSLHAAPDLVYKDHTRQQLGTLIVRTSRVDDSARAAGGHAEHPGTDSKGRHFQLGHISSVAAHLVRLPPCRAVSRTALPRTSFARRWLRWGAGSVPPLQGSPLLPFLCWACTNRWARMPGTLSFFSKSR